MNSLLLLLWVSRGLAVDSPHPPVLALRTGGGFTGSHVPAFWETPRSRIQAEAELRWAPSSRTWLNVSVDGWRHDTHEDGAVFSGPGDITMGGRAWISQGPVFTGIAFAVKQPNADDERELGTDETDISLLATTATARGPVWIQAHGGISFLGDPHRFSSQDAVPTFAATTTVDAGPVSLHSTLRAALETQHNPGRWTLSVGGEGHCPWLMGTAALVGLSPAAPSWGARIWAGWGWGCSE